MQSERTYMHFMEAIELEGKLNAEEEDGYIYLAVHCCINEDRSYLCVFDEKGEFICGL